MQYLVSRNKKDGKIFIETKMEREKRNSNSEWISSVILKGFDSYEKALAYKQEQERVDGIIGELFLN